MLKLVCEKNGAHTLETLFNYTDNNGATPLHYAAAANYTPSLKILLKFNADISACDNDGLTPIQYSVIHDSKQAMHLLISHDRNTMAAQLKTRVSIHTP